MRKGSPRGSEGPVEPAASDRLDSWKEIAAYLRREIRTLQRWEKHEGLPVRRHLHDKLGTVYAYKSELDAWWNSRLPASQQGEPREARPVTNPWRQRMAVGAAAALVLLAALSLWPGRPSRLRFQERDWVLVASFENRTGEPLFDRTLEAALERELSDSRFVNVVPRERVADALRLMKRPADAPVDATLGREICLRDGGIRALVAGRVDKVGTRYVLSVQIVDPSRKLTVASRSEEAAGHETLLPALRRLSSWTREALGEAVALVQRSEQELEKATTPSLAALQLYTQSVSAGNLNQWGAAEALTRRAIALDPEFASAHLWLAWAVRNQGRSAKEYLPHAKRAFRLSEKTSERERYFILGSYYGMTGQQDEAIGAYEALVRLSPDHYWGTNNLGYSYAFVGRMGEAIPQMVRYAELRPHDLRANVRAAEALAIWGADPARAEAYLARARELLSPEMAAVHPREVAWTELFSAHERWVGGDLAAALDEVTRVAQTVGSRSGRERDAFASQVGHFYLTLGKLNAAEEICQRHGGDGCLADVELARGDRQALKRHLAGFLKSPAPKGLGSLVVAVRAGLLAEAQQVLSFLESEHPPESVQSIARGEVALARGRRGQAIPLLETGVTLSRYRGWGSFFLASESLAEAWEQEGETEKALQVLEEASRQRRRAYIVSDGSVGFLWMRAESLLARSYRKAGRAAEAQAIEAALARLLRYADGDHPVLLELGRRDQ